MAHLEQQSQEGFGGDAGQCSLYLLTVPHSSGNNNSAPQIKGHKNGLVTVYDVCMCKLYAHLHGMTLIQHR